MKHWLQKKFSRKLTLSFNLLILLAMSITGFSLTHVLKKNLIQELTINLTTQAKIMASQLPANFLKDTSPAEIQNFSYKFGKACGCRVTILDTDGRVLADSSLTVKDLEAVENHKFRPEIQAAIAGQSQTSIRESRTLGVELIYAAVPMINQQNVSGIIRVALPLTDVHNKIETIGKLVFGLTVLMLFLSFLISLWISRSISWPVREISDVANRISEGDYSARVHRRDKDEHGQLGEALNLLADKVQKSISDLSREKSELSAILNNMTEAVAAVDAKGRIMMINPSFTSLFGLNKEEAQTKPFLEIVRNNQVDILMTSALTSGQSQTGEITLLSPVERIFACHAAPLVRGVKKEGVLIVMRDLTDTRKLEKVRREFVANVSHELRTPLAAIRGFAETLMGTGENEAKVRKEFLTAIERHVDNMDQLVDDLLTLSEVESHQRPAQLGEVSMERLASEVVNNLAPLADKNKIQITVSRNTSIPLLRTDMNRIKQVLTNLITNAIKFNNEGGRVDISFAVAPKELKVLIADTGIGIPSDDLPRIFERFYRVDKARSRERGGTGLGLSIVKHIVESLEGVVSVESTLGQGTTFIFSLPIKDTYL